MAILYFLGIALYGLSLAVQHIPVFAQIGAMPWPRLAARVLRYAYHSVAFCSLLSFALLINAYGWNGEGGRNEELEHPPRPLFPVWDITFGNAQILQVATWNSQAVIRATPLPSGWRGIMRMTVTDWTGRQHRVDMQILREHEMGCAICQRAYTIGDRVRKMVCGHFYHVACIRREVSRGGRCPGCIADSAAEDREVD